MDALQVPCSTSPLSMENAAVRTITWRCPYPPLLPPAVQRLSPGNNKRWGKKILQNHTPPTNIQKFSTLSWSWDNIIAALAMCGEWCFQAAQDHLFFTNVGPGTDLGPGYWARVFSVNEGIKLLMLFPWLWGNDIHPSTVCLYLDKHHIRDIHCDTEILLGQQANMILKNWWQFHELRTSHFLISSPCCVQVCKTQCQFLRFS